jgi:hypothetical protein
MVWWPASETKREWRIDGRETAPVTSDTVHEACHASCPLCEAPLFVVIEFRDLVPEAVLQIGVEAEWPAGYLR